MTIPLTPLQSTTALDIMQEALENLRVISPSQTLSSVQATNYLRSLNMLMNTLSGEGLMIPALTLESFSLIAGQEAYTIGPNGDFNTTRPESIEVRSCYVLDASGNKYLLLPKSREEYRSLPAALTTTTYPAYLYYDPQYPLGRIYLYYPPIAGLTLYLASFKPLSRFADLTTEITFPAGYSELLVSEATIRWATKHGKPIPDSAVAIMKRIRSTLEAKHSQPLRKDINIPTVSGAGVQGGFDPNVC